MREATLGFIEPPGGAIDRAEVSERARDLIGIAASARDVNGVKRVALGSAVARPVNHPRITPCRSNRA